MSTSRQLAAILFADIQGYTALMQRDEASAMFLRDKFQRNLEKEIKSRNGRIATFSGDGALCVFKSAIEAVQAAIAVQERMREDPVVPLRIGIHTGDVISEGKNVYGDGVNIASRIESFAVAGSIFISEKVADEIKNQQRIESISLGKFELKNVEGAIGIHAIKHPNLIVPQKEKLSGKGQHVSKRPVSQKKMIWALAAFLILVAASFFAYKKYTASATTTSADSPAIKTIAVLPFSNLSGQKDDEYFADGVCDEILTQLSKISALNVLSRTSTLQFRDTKKTMREIGEQIGAEVLLEGSVQKSNGKVRINVQLIDAVNDKHLWAETYDRELKDIFSIQSEIAGQIAEALNTKLTDREEELVKEKPTENMQAYDLYMRANKKSESFWAFDKMEDVPDAVKMYEDAVRLDPKFLDAYDGLVALYTEISWRKPVINYEEYRLKAKEWLDKMVALKIDKPIVHRSIYLYKYEGERDYDGALAELDLIDKATGNKKYTLESRAYVLRRMGRIDEALQYFLQVLSMYPKFTLLRMEIVSTYRLLRNADSSISQCDKAISQSPDVVTFYENKAGIYADLKGDTRTAREILKNSASFVDTNEYTGNWTYIFMLEGNYNEAIRRLSDSADSMWVVSQENMIPAAQEIGILYNNQGNKEQSKAYFQKSYQILSRLVQLHPQDFRIHSALGVTLAGLGEKEKALEEGMRARNMMPVSADAVIGLVPLENLALINVLLGNQDAAIDILEQLLKMPCSWGAGSTIPLYKMHPYWKLLQNNARFQKLIGR